MNRWVLLALFFGTAGLLSLAFFIAPDASIQEDSQQQVPTSAPGANDPSTFEARPDLPADRLERDVEAVMRLDPEPDPIPHAAVSTVGGFTAELVLKETGQAAVGARVFLIDENGEPGNLLPDPHIADDAGRVQAEIEPGRYRIFIFHERSDAELEGPYVVERDLPLGRVELPVGGSVLVRVLSLTDDLPIDDPNIQISRKRPDSGFDFKANTLASCYEMLRRKEAEEVEPSRFLLRGLRPGSYSSNIHSDGFVSHKAEFEVHASETTELVCTMQPSSRLTATVSTSDGQAAPSSTRLRIQAVDRGESNESLFRTCNSRGIAKFEDLSPGPYAISVVHDRWKGEHRSTELARVTLFPGENELQLKLPPRLRLRIHLSDKAGNPISDADLRVCHVASVWSFDEPETRARGVAEEPGTFLAQDLEAGDHGIKILRHGFLPAVSRVQLTEDMQEHRVQLGGVNVSGQVLGGAQAFSILLHGEHFFARPGEAPPDPNDPRPHRRNIRLEAKVSGTVDGQFQIRGVSPGRYRLFFEAREHFALTNPTIIEVGGSDLTDLEIQARPAGGLVLRVSGVSLLSGSIYSYDLLDDEGRRLSGELAIRNGDHRVSGLAPGLYRIQITSLASWEAEATCQIVADIPVQVHFHRESKVEWQPKTE